MEILVAYDVATSDPMGRRRLRHVAKICEGFGQRVQLSVFECVVSESQFVTFEARLLDAIDPGADSLRIYRLREPRRQHMTVHGRKPEFDIDGPLVL